MIKLKFGTFLPIWFIIDLGIIFVFIEIHYIHGLLKHFETTESAFHLLVNKVTFPTQSFLVLLLTELISKVNIWTSEFAPSWIHHVTVSFEEE